MTYIFNCSVAFTCPSASELSVDVIVGSVYLEYHVKDQIISCILLISSFDSGDEVYSGVGCCTFDP